jgi:hypothetical protein
MDMDKFINREIAIVAEGAELSILKGAVECLERFHPIISIEYGEPSYSAYGLTADSLYIFASEQNTILRIFAEMLCSISICGEIYVILPTGIIF